MCEIHLHAHIWMCEFVEGDVFINFYKYVIKFCRRANYITEVRTRNPELGAQNLFTFRQNSRHSASVHRLAGRTPPRSPSSQRKTHGSVVEASCFSRLWADKCTLLYPYFGGCIGSVFCGFPRFIMRKCELVKTFCQYGGDPKWRVSYNVLYV